MVNVLNSYCQKNFNQLSRVHERYRLQTDDRETDERQHIANMNHEREITFAKISDTLFTMSVDFCAYTRKRQHNENQNGYHA